MSLFPLLSGGVTPVASMLAGAVTERLGFMAGFWACGGLGLTVVTGLCLWWWRIHPDTPRP